MRRYLIILLLLPLTAIAKDYLLAAIYGEYANEYNRPDEYNESDRVGDAEVIEWNLGERDDLPELEIIYEDKSSPCEY